MTWINNIFHNRRPCGVRYEGSKKVGALKIDTLISKIHTQNFSFISLKQLLINYENIVFGDGKSTLMLEGLDIIKVVSNRNTYSYKYDFVSDYKLYNVISKLDSGRYKLEFDFYVESYFETNIFKFVSNYKDLLKEGKGKLGYLELLSLTITLDDNLGVALYDIESLVIKTLSDYKMSIRLNLRIDKGPILLINKIKR